MMKRFAAVILFGLVPAAGIQAELPIYISVDTSGSYSFTYGSFCFDNQITVGKTFGVLSGLFVEGGNLLGYDEEFMEEVFAGAGISFFDWLTLGLQASIAIVPYFDFYLTPELELSWEFEEAGITLSDTNELVWFVLDGVIEYNNTFDAAVSFDLGKKVSLGISASNEFSWLSETGEINDCISVGPALTAAFLGVGLHYDLGLVPELDHGMGLDISLSF